MLGLEAWALLACWTFALSGTACDSLRNQAGNSTWNCFCLQQTVLSGCVPGNQNPWGKSWERSATQRGRRQGRSSPAPPEYSNWERKSPSRHNSHPTHNKGKGNYFWSVLFRKQPQWMFSGNKLAFICICSLCSLILGSDSKVCKLRWVLFGHAELKNQQSIFKQTNKLVQT